MVTIAHELDSRHVTNKRLMVDYNHSAMLKTTNSTGWKPWKLQH